MLNKYIEYRRELKRLIYISKKESVSYKVINYKYLKCCIIIVYYNERHIYSIEMDYNLYGLVIELITFKKMVKDDFGNYHNKIIYQVRTDELRYNLPMGFYHSTNDDEDISVLINILKQTKI